MNKINHLELSLSDFISMNIKAEHSGKKIKYAVRKGKLYQCDRLPYAEKASLAELLKVINRKLKNEFCNRDQCQQLRNILDKKIESYENNRQSSNNPFLILYTRKVRIAYQTTMDTLYEKEFSHVLEGLCEIKKDRNANILQQLIHIPRFYESNLEEVKNLIKDIDDCTDVRYEQIHCALTKHRDSLIVLREFGLGTSDDDELIEFEHILLQDLIEKNPFETESMPSVLQTQASTDFYAPSAPPLEAFDDWQLS